MTHTKSEQIVREAVIQAVPEILELKDGCLMMIWWINSPYEYPPDEKRTEFTSRTMRDNGRVDEKYQQIIEDNVTGTVFSLGRPIRLADILYTIGVVQKRASYYVEVGSGRFIKSEHQRGINEDGSANSRDTDTGIYYNLRADSLSEQSDETIHFLAELFSKGE